MKFGDTITFRLGNRIVKGTFESLYFTAAGDISFTAQVEYGKVRDIALEDLVLKSQEASAKELEDLKAVVNSLFDDKIKLQHELDLKKDAVENCQRAINSSAVVIRRLEEDNRRVVKQREESDESRHILYHKCEEANRLAANRLAQIEALNNQLKTAAEIAESTQAKHEKEINDAGIDLYNARYHVQRLEESGDLARLSKENQNLVVRCNELFQQRENAERDNFELKAKAKTLSQKADILEYSIDIHRKMLANSSENNDAHAAQNKLYEERLHAAERVIARIKNSPLFYSRKIAQEYLNTRTT